MESRTQTCLGATISFSQVNEKVPIMQALIFPMHTFEDMPDRWIMKVYSPGTPHGMVMKTFIRRTRPSICLSKERSRHVLPTIPLSDYLCGQMVDAQVPYKASQVTYPYHQCSRCKVSDTTHRVWRSVADKIIPMVKTC